MTGPVAELAEAFDRTPIVAIIRCRARVDLTDVLRVLVTAGIGCVEVTVPTPGSLATVEAAARDHPGLLIGAGTVLTVDDVDRCARAGARFVVTPVVDTQVIGRAIAAGLPIVPGALTPTEIVTAYTAGAAAVKVFPAARLGPDYLRDLSGPLPHIPLVPTGGIGLNDVAPYLRAGGAAVGLGGPLIGDALTGGRLSALAARADAFVAAARGARR
jgi:2-dehydro-3-deoxyphosphogluconate aldolase/(4S)-4-hydroxy-2-oxoglutarate aldolase